MAERVLFKDVVPYDTPSSLDALSGPSTGIIELPLNVDWSPQRHYDLSKSYDVKAAYQALIREGTSEIQEALLNSSVLRRAWPKLTLPERCRQTWEHRFPDLAA